LNAAQAIEFRRPQQSSPALEKLLGEFRKTVPFMKEDGLMYEFMHGSQQFVKQHAW
jgi:histidine ammonia-lyase